MIDSSTFVQAKVSMFAFFYFLAFLIRSLRGFFTILRGKWEIKNINIKVFGFYYNIM